MEEHRPDAESQTRDIWFPEAFDGREFSFVRTNRAALAVQTFLDPRWDRSRAEHKKVALGALAEGAPPALNFIWHTGFCCSTLLAKALNKPGANLSLCEPVVLVDVANAKRDPGFGSDARTKASKLAFDLLGQSGAGETVTIKPSPAANSLIGAATKETTGRMLFLYSDCRGFVVSIAKMGEEGRKYVRRLYLNIMGDGHFQAQWPPATALLLSDLELAAMVWHMQIAEFRRHWPELSAGRARSLDCEVLLADPAHVLAKADEFLELGLGADYLREVASGPLFHRNAKTGELSFDASRRRDERAHIVQALGSDLDRVVERSYAICRDTPRAAPVPDPLITAK